MLFRSVRGAMVALVLIVCMLFVACASAAEEDVNDCPHLNVDQFECMYVADYKPIDEKKHLLEGFVEIDTYCSDCGEVVKEEITNTPKTDEGDHWFDDGVCRLCLYVNTCPHEHIFPNDDYYVWNDEPSCTDNGDGTHTVSGYGYVSSSEYCSVCGESWETPGESGPIVYTEKHYFWDGLCEGCGAENTCDHAHVHSSVEFESVSECDPIDAQTHRVTGYTQLCNYCPECREGWYGETSAEKSERTEDHYFDEGICQDCGYINICTHENVVELEDIWMAMGTRYVGYDEQCHTIYAYVNHFLMCADCGEKLEYLYCDLQPEVKEAHSFENGSCNCGYVKPTVSPDDPYGDSVAYLPDSLDVIDAEALLGIAARTVVIPDGATTIGARAFASCPNLEYVVVPDSVRSIATDAFSGSSVTFICSTDSTAADYAQSHNIPLK